ncbi:hypothetical protein RvY_10597 [Ramazzottius varieornatus]|uniref:Uncharacterized protein n=1 Tax=Ramazzottius varieornatus TaxID=947166 RepID=A0A1D1VDC2_RAMVA|nr:hypothetical protein RvY_10597 [Ramazzottius varieornatus]
MKKADEGSITANPLRAMEPPGRDFAIRGVLRHVIAEQLKDYIPVGSGDTKSPTVGRIGVHASDATLS